MVSPSNSYLKFPYLLVLCGSVLLTACEDPTPTLNPGGPEQPPVNESSVTDSTLLDRNPEYTLVLNKLSEAYLAQIDTDFSIVSDELEIFNSSVVEFLSTPSASTMNVVRTRWLNAHSAYERMSLQRYFIQLLLPEAASLEVFKYHYRINYWPILPGYIDYLSSFSESGIVHDITVPIDLLSLQQQHGLFELREASLGFHVLEFLLWGENTTEDSLRPPADYQEDKVLNNSQIESGLSIDQLPNNRRRQYLSIASQALIADFSAVQMLWQLNSADVQSRLGTMDSSELLRLFMEAAAGMLTEELLLPSLYPLLNGDYQQSIQSPYSDSAQNVIAAQLLGVEQLLTEIDAVNGITLGALLASISEDFEDLFYLNFDASKECLVILYSTLEVEMSASPGMEKEIEIVECINLLTNMINHFEQLKFSLDIPLNNADNLL